MSHKCEAYYLYINQKLIENKRSGKLSKINNN